MSPADGEIASIRAATRRAVTSLWQARLADPAYDEAVPGGPPRASLEPGSASARPAALAPAGAGSLAGEVSGPAAVFGSWGPGGDAGGPGMAAWARAAASKAAGLGAFVTLYDAPGLSRRGHASRGGAGEQQGPVAGLPVAVKDVFDIAGQRVGNGTSGFGHRTPGSDCPAWARLRAAGAVLIGRTRLPELAWDVRTPGCQNPWAPGYDPGGSSGGSAAAVAAGVVPVALGSDTGGSIRIPAALCGVAGLRPTAGTVCRRGVTPLAPAMDTVGPIATTAAGCLLIHQLLAGSPPPEQDAPGSGYGHGVPAPPGDNPPSPGTLRVGWPAHLWQGRVSADVAAAIEATADALRRAGVSIEPVDLPLAGRYARIAAYVIILAESAGLWSPRLAAAGPGALSSRTAALLGAGAELAMPDYFQARRVAAAIRRETVRALARQRLAALLLPTVPAAAARTGAASVRIAGRDVPAESAYVSLTGLASVTGLPALSVPCGLDGQGLPLGAQLVGPPGTEPVLCLLGHLVEESPGGLMVAAARQRLAARLAGDDL